MKTAFEARVGSVLRMGNDLLLVIKHEFHRGGRGSTTVNMRLKNLKTGATMDRSMDSEEKLDDVVLERQKAEYLYENVGTYAFMLQDTFETLELNAENIGDASLYLIEGLIVDIQQFEGAFIGIMLPARVTLEVVEAEPAVRGNTADGKVDKLVKLSTGLELRVPGFVEQGASIVVSTETGEYLERAK